MEISNIKFYENPSSGSRVVLCGRRHIQTDRNVMKLTDSLRNFANVSATLNLKRS